MLHTRIIGFGWLVLGTIWFCILLFLTGEAVSSYHTRPNPAIAGIIVQGVLGLAISSVVPFVGYGVLRHRRWAVISCRVISFLTMLLSLVIMFGLGGIFMSTKNIPDSGAYPDGLIELVGVGLIVAFSVYSLFVVRHEAAA
jgi:hypothetical protein